MKKLLAAAAAALLLLVSCACVQAAPSAAAKDTRVRVTAPIQAPVGQPFYLEVRANAPLEDLTVTWRGQKISLIPHDGTARTILGVPNSAKLVGKTFSLAVEFTAAGKPRRVVRNVTAVKHAYPRQELTVAPKMVRPPKEELDRIAAERKLVAAALAVKEPGGVLPRPGGLVRPVAGIRTASFGGFRVYNGVPRAGHGGLDLRAAVGTSVKALHDGVVVLTGEHYFSGGAVYVSHGGGVFSAYFHLSKILVEKGQHVKAGDVIALSGATGRVTGPHLHLGIYAGGAWLDALPLLGEAPLPKGAEKLYIYKNQGGTKK